MIDPSSSQADAVSSQHTGKAQVFRMIRSERTAGSMPAWVSEDSKVQDLELVDGEGSVYSVGNSFRDTLDAQQKADSGGPSSSDEPFGFFDLLDMINPLQHIPILSFFYRAITGDEIRPISKIIGGGIFGGPLGAASGLVSAVIEDGTGKEPVDLALSMFDGKKPVLSQKAAQEYAQTQTASQRRSQGVTYNA